MEQKIKEIYDFLCNEEFLYVLGEKNQEYVDETYYEIFKEDKVGFDSIAWHELIDGIIRFEYISLINIIGSENNENLINKYFESIADRKEEITQLAKLVDEYTNMIYKNNKENIEIKEDEIICYEDEAIIF